MIKTTMDEVMVVAAVRATAIIGRYDLGQEIALRHGVWICPVCVVPGRMPIDCDYSDQRGKYMQGVRVCGDCSKSHRWREVVYNDSEPKL